MKKILLLTFIVFIANLSFAQNGIRKIYYSKGKLESAVSFVDEVLEGTSKWYYENGNIKTEKTYSNGVLNGWVREYYESGLLKEEYFVRNGVLDGIAKRHFDNGAIEFVKIFDNGKLKSKKKFTYDSLFVATMELFVGISNKLKRKNENLFLCNIDVCPEPIGGIEAIEKKIITPAKTGEINSIGFVIVTALISKRGNVKKVKVEKSFNDRYDNAIVSAVKGTRFTPGKNKDKIVDAEVTLRVNFKFNKNKDKLIVNNSSNVEKSPKVKQDTIKPLKIIICDGTECPKLKESKEEFLKRVRYPFQAKRNNIKGNVIIEAKINDLGFVISTNLVKGIGYGCDYEAKSQVQRTQFIPAKRNGKEVSSIVKISVPFGKKTNRVK